MLMLIPVSWSPTYMYFLFISLQKIPISVTQWAFNQPFTAIFVYNTLIANKCLTRDVNKGSTCEEVVRFAALSPVSGLTGMQGRMGWRETEWQTGNSGGAGGALVIRLRPLTSFGTGADHGGCRWINQGHVDALRAVLWTDDLGQAFGPRLAQQLTCKTKRRVYWQ